MYKKLFLLNLLFFMLFGKSLLYAQNMMYYTSDEHGYSIQLPEEWKRSDEVSEKVALVMLSDEGASANVTFYELNGMSPEQFIDRYEKSTEGNLQGLIIHEKGVFKSRDDDAVYLVYSFNKDGKAIREKACFYSRENEMVVVIVSNAEDKFHNDLAIFDKVLHSFTFETVQDKVEEVD